MLPIFKSLLRNKASYLLVSIQVAITLAVLVNAMALVKRSQEIIHEPSGIMGDEIIAIRVVPFDPAYNDLAFEKNRLRQDLEFLRQYPGVIDASCTNSFPGDIGSNNTVSVAGSADTGNGISAGTFIADDHLLDTLGVPLVSGRNFTPGEIYFSHWPPADKAVPQVIIITKQLARTLFGDAPAVGKSVKINATTRTVIGVTDTYRGRNPIIGDARYSAFLPGYLSAPRVPVNFLVRVKAGNASRMIEELKAALLKQDGGRDIDEARVLDELINRGNGLYAYGGMVLMTISALLVLTTALGIFGVAFFSVTKRTRQIGARRALGATRADIIKHFAMENLITTGTGVVLGGFLAIALNIQMTRLGLGRTDYLVTGMAMLFVLAIGQLSVLAPAWKAAGIDPAIATRQ